MDLALNGKGPFLRLDEDRSISYGAAKTAIAEFPFVVKKGEALVVTPEIREGDVGIGVEDYWNCTLLVVGGVGPHGSSNGELAHGASVPFLDGCKRFLRHGGGCESGDQKSTNV